MILYLHGFRSSPQSWKARALGEALAARGQAAEYACPALSYDPQRAMATAEGIVQAALAAGKAVTLAGSSLGGFYATWLAEKYDLKAALINPAVLAHLSMQDYIGPQTELYTGETFEFTQAHVDCLRTLEVPCITPQRYLLLVETGDEVLDYRQAVARYAGAAQIVLPGGDHSFTQFVNYIPKLIDFSGL